MPVDSEFDIFGSLCNLELFLTSQFLDVARWTLSIHVIVESLHHGLKPFVKGSMPPSDGRVLSCHDHLSNLPLTLWIASSFVRSQDLSICRSNSALFVHKYHSQIRCITTDAFLEASSFVASTVGHSWRN